MKDVGLCKYKNTLGKPGKGVHSYRLFGVALADVINDSYRSCNYFLFF